MSNSVWPHRWQPTRLPRPWDSPGKNTGVGCHFLLQCMKVKTESEVAQSYPTLSDPMDCSPPGSSIHGIFQARALEWGAIAFSLDVSKKSQIHILLLWWPLPLKKGPQQVCAVLFPEALWFFSHFLTLGLYGWYLEGLVMPHGVKPAWWASCKHG